MFDWFWLSVPVQLIAWKDSSPNDVLCVEWDVKPYILTLTIYCLFTYLLVSIVGITNNKYCTTIYSVVALMPMHIVAQSNILVQSLDSFIV